MRPRLRSYGLNSIATRSPGRMRMKFFRIRPETCANIWCLFSNSTLNIALGSVSTTTAITSIASSFDKPYPDSARSHSGKCPNLLRQNHCALLSHGHRVLKMGAQTAVFSHRRPSILQHLDARAPDIHHRLDRQHHPCAKLRTLTPLPVVRNL